MSEQKFVTNANQEEQVQAAAPALKTSFRIKALAFTFTVITLSWFFEGWREVSAELTVPHCAVLLAGTVLTLGLLGVQGYWIYVEEKTKGTLRRRIALFEKVYETSPQGRGRRGNGEGS